MAVDLRVYRKVNTTRTAYKLWLLGEDTITLRQAARPHAKYGHVPPWFDPKRRAFVNAPSKALGGYFGGGMRGYWYDDNEYNRRMLYRVQECAKQLSRKYRIDAADNRRPYEISGPKKNGRLDWDVPCVMDAWIVDGLNAVAARAGKKFTYDPATNPIIGEDGRTMDFQINGMKAFDVAAMLGAIRAEPDLARRLGGKVVTELPVVHFVIAKDPRQFVVWCPTDKDLVYYTGREKVMERLRTFFRDLERGPKHASMWLAWGSRTSGHARTGYYDANIRRLTIIDPWMHLKNDNTTRDFQQRGLAVLREAAAAQAFASKTKRPPISVVFEQRKPEQTSVSGDCSLIALVRTLMMTEYGPGGANAAVPPQLMIFVKQMATMFRNSRPRRKIRH